MTEKDSAGFVDSKENKWVGSYQSWSKEWTVRHSQSKEASILWSHREETRELHGEKDYTRNNTRCTQARKTTHSVDGQHQDVDRKSQSEWQRTEIKEESSSMVWPTLGSRTANKQAKTNKSYSNTARHTFRITLTPGCNFWAYLLCETRKQYTKLLPITSRQMLTPDSKYQKATSLWTLGCHKPVIPVLDLW